MICETLNFCDLCLTRHLKNSANKPAIVYFGVSEQRTMFLKYSELEVQVLKTAKVLILLGMQASDCILLAMPQIPETVFIILACAKLGITANIIDPLTEVKGLTKVLEELRPKLIFSASYGLDREGVAVDYNLSLNESVEKICPSAFIVLIQRDIYQTLYIKPSLHLDFHTLLAFFSTQNLLDPCPTVDSPPNLFSLFINDLKITKTSHQVLVSLQNAMKTKRENPFWLAVFPFWSLEGLSMGIYGPLINGGACVFLESWEGMNTKLGEMLGKVDIDGFCGSCSVFEIIENQNKGFLDNIETLFLILVKNEGLSDYLCSRNGRNFEKKPVQSDFDSYFEGLFVKYQRNDGFEEEIEMFLREKTGFSGIFALRTEKNIHVIVTNTAFFIQIQEKIEEVLKNSFNFTIEPLKTAECNDEKSLRALIKQRFLKESAIISNLPVQTHQIFKRAHPESIDFNEFHSQKKLKI